MLASAQEVGGLARSGTAAHVREVQAQKSLTRQGLAAARGVWLTQEIGSQAVIHPSRGLCAGEEEKTGNNQCMHGTALAGQRAACKTETPTTCVVNRAQQSLQRATQHINTRARTAEALQAQIKCKSTGPLIRLARLQDPTLFEPAAVISRASSELTPTSCICELLSHFFNSS